MPCAIAAGLAVASGLSAAAQTLELQLQAGNYDATRGVWYDSSINNNNATYSGTAMPTLVSGATPNGSSVVRFANNGVLSLAAPINAGGSYTAFAYIKPTDGGDYALFGGTAWDAFEWRTYQGHQQPMEEWVTTLGNGSGTLSYSGFNLIDCTVSSSGGVMNLNGAADGTTTAPPGNLLQPIVFIGNNMGATGGEAFSGDIAEIDIYGGVMTSAQINAVEAQLTAEYVTAVPEPTTWAMMAGALGMLFGARRFRRPQA
jgi:hypothetical protein